MKIGVIGGGQLGRMLALAGTPLGMNFAFLDPAPDACAAALGEHLRADYSDPDHLRQLADEVDLVTFEFESVPAETVAFLSQFVPVYPSAEALRIARDRWFEKSMFKDLGIPTPDFADIQSQADLDAAVASIGLPAVLKTRTLGYDGKGQKVLRTAADVEGTFAELGSVACLLEGFVPFTGEVSLIAVRGRDGESGLSKLTEIKAPLQWSTVPFGDSRLDLNVTPISLNAGSSSDESSRRFGTGALIQGEVAKDLYDSSTTTPPELPNIDKIKVPSQGSQSTAGVEVAMALTGEQYKLDVGSTPLGQDLNTVVGGVQWSPQLTDYLKLILTGERRAVVDSLLSYVGVEDKYSGKKWGQVTKNGGSAQLSYDDGDAGFYAGVGLYNYIGENVPSNDNFTGNAGVYIRPYRADDRELKTGISMTYMDFSKNLSYFSYGQGGYFSPQDYISVSFAVDGTQKVDNGNRSDGACVVY